jgi:hypothetical protein
VPATSLAQIVDVETYSGDKTYTYVLPGTNSGNGLLFVEDLTVTSLSFTPDNGRRPSAPTRIRPAAARCSSWTPGKRAAAPLTQPHRKSRPLLSARCAARIFGC